MTRDEAEKAVAQKLGFRVIAASDELVEPRAAIRFPDSVALLNRKLWSLAVSQQQRIGELEEGWISVEERLPEKHQSVLASDGERVWEDYRDAAGWVYQWGNNTPTDWRPLPAPPEVKP